METNTEKQMTDEIKLEWACLWRDRYDDRLRAEGISRSVYPSLFVEKGLVIFATRGFRPLNLREIMFHHGIGDPDRFVPPDPSVGGWGKFIRSTLPRSKRFGRAEQVRRDLKQTKVKQQLKKGGRGWLHT